MQANETEALVDQGAELGEVLTGLGTTDDWLAHSYSCVLNHFCQNHSFYYLKIRF